MAAAASSCWTLQLPFWRWRCSEAGLDWGSTQRNFLAAAEVRRAWLCWGKERELCLGGHQCSEPAVFWFWSCRSQLLVSCLPSWGNNIPSTMETPHLRSSKLPCSGCCYCLVLSGWLWFTLNIYPSSPDLSYWWVKQDNEVVVLTLSWCCPRGLQLTGRDGLGISVQFWNPDVPHSSWSWPSTWGLL